MEGMLFAVLVACEIGFWVILGAGLAARYLLRMRRLGAVLLVCTPVVDLVLFAATVLDLRGGATASATHGLAAAYIGFSIAFGHSLIRWADQRVAHRFFGGPPPWKPPKGGRARAAYEWREWRAGLLGWAVACAMLGGGILMLGDWERSQELAAWAGRLTFALVIWLVFWPIWHTISSLGQPQHGPRDGGEDQLDPAAVDPDVRVRARDDRAG
jgi:hypothetical protein